MLEKQIEDYVRDRLKAWGFRVLKFTCPGTTGVMDRIILRPSYSPGAPFFCEFKKPAGRLKGTQSIMAMIFANSGCQVINTVWDMEDAYKLCDALIDLVEDDYHAAKKKEQQ